MEFDLDTKYLILDKSGFDGFALAFSKGVIDDSVFSNFLEKNSITPVITHEAFNAGEFTVHSYAPNLFSGITAGNGDYKKVETISFNSDGTLTSAWKQNSVQVISTSTYSNTKSQEELSGFKITKSEIQQLLLWESSEHWKKIYSSLSDISVVYLSREFAKKAISFSILVNDWPLREQLSLEGYSVIGSSALLAEMALTKIISSQMGSFIYYNLWLKANPKLVPKKNNFTKEKYKFKEILQMEAEKRKKGENFFNYFFK